MQTTTESGFNLGRAMYSRGGTPTADELARNPGLYAGWSWQAGYERGYSGKLPCIKEVAYMRGYDAGKAAYEQFLSQSP